MKSQFIYQAKKIERESNRHGKGYSIKVKERSLGMFSSKNAAEEAILKCVNDYKHDNGWTYGLTGFYVKKYMLDQALALPDTWRMPITEEEWSYTKDGKQFSYTPFSSDWKDGEYSGTSPDAIKFKVGDFAWSYTCGSFMPVRVLATPYTPEEWKKKFKFASDASDDCYLVIDAFGHDHPQTINLFPIDETLPQSVIDAMDKAEHEYYGK